MTQTPERQTPERQRPEGQGPVRPLPEHSHSERPLPERPHPERPRPERPSALRAAHRAHAGLTILVVLALLVLNLTGVLDRGAALRLFLAIEAPLLLVLIGITVLRFGRIGRSARTGAGILERLEAEEPLLRPMVSELRAFGCLALAIARKRRFPQGSQPFGYTKGTLALPAAMIAASLVELVIVHALVPWPWLRIVLLVLPIWSILFVLGFFAVRAVHPHFVTADALHLRWGHRTVLTASLADIRSAVPHLDHTRTQPQIDGERLILTQFQSTNVLVRFAEPVPAAAPVAKKRLPADFRASEVRLYVDDPDAFVRALRPVPESETA